MPVQPTARRRDAGEIFSFTSTNTLQKCFILFQRWMQLQVWENFNWGAFQFTVCSQNETFSLRSDPLSRVLAGEKKKKTSWPFRDASQPRNLTSEDKVRTRRQPPAGGAGRESSSEVKCHRRTHKFHFKTCQLLLSFQTRPGLWWTREEPRRITSPSSDPTASHLQEGE